MLNDLLTSPWPPSLRANEANGNHPVPGGLWRGQALMELDCVCHFTCSYPTMLQLLWWDPNQPTAGSMIPNLTLHTGWECSWGREQMHLSRHWSKSMCSHCDLDDTTLDPAFTTLLCMSWTYSRCWPRPHIAQGVLATRKIDRASELRSGNFTWSSCNRLFCAKLKQCVVLACCILYKNPFPPPPIV